MMNNWNLCRFGGIYLDMDVLVLRPMDNLRNTLGSEITANGNLRLSGAVLVFEKSRFGLPPLYELIKFLFFLVIHLPERISSFLSD